MKSSEMNKENIVGGKDMTAKKGDAKTSKRQALKSFASKLRRSSSKRESNNVFDHPASMPI